MKNRLVVVAALIAGVLFYLSCKKSGKDTVMGPDPGSTVQGRYKNGLFKGATEKDYEGYNAIATIEVRGNRISIVDWQIYDNNLKRFFDAAYEHVYSGNPLYIQQCRDNMKGMVAYGPRLIETQDVDSVECITGATWCHNKFKQVVKISLKDASLDPSDPDA